MPNMTMHSPSQIKTLWTGFNSTLSETAALNKRIADQMSLLTNEAPAPDDSPECQERWTDLILCISTLAARARDLSHRTSVLAIALHENQQAIAALPPEFLN